jgi:hypothetical protein
VKHATGAYNAFCRANAGFFSAEFAARNQASIFPSHFARADGHLIDFAQT